MTRKRFFIHKNMVSDTDMKIPITIWSNKKQQKEFCDELNALHEENQKLKEMMENFVNKDAEWEKKARQQVYELEEENKELKLRLSHLEYRFTEYRNKVNK